MARFEERLSMIESLIGLDSCSEEPNVVTNEEIASRVQNVLHTIKSRLKNHPSPSSLHQQGRTSARIHSLEDDLKDLRLDNPEQSLLVGVPQHFLASAISTASSQGNVNNVKPLVYRNQEVLARSKELEEAMGQISTIRDLICKSNPKGSNCIIIYESLHTRGDR